MKQIDFEKVVKFAIRNYKLGNLHGIPHWQRVERNGFILLSTHKELMTDRNLTVIKLFAYLHDVCRDTNLKDPFHGERAALLVESIRSSLLFGLLDSDISNIVEACRTHNDTLKTGNLIIDMCFDADRLDLPRCGIMPNPDRMATTQGKFFANNMGIFNQRIREYEVL